MHRQHRSANQPAQQRPRIEQPDQSAFVSDAQAVVEMEWDAQEQIAERDAKDQRRNNARDKKCPVPHAPPAGGFKLAAERKRHRPQNQRCQHQKHGEIKARKRHRVERRPSGKSGTAAEDEPDLIAFPDRADRIEQHAFFDIGAGDKRLQQGGAEVKAVHHRKTDQQHAEKRPPDQAQNCVIDRDHGAL